MGVDLLESRFQYMYCNSPRFQTRHLTSCNMCQTDPCTGNLTLACLSSKLPNDFCHLSYP